MRVMSGKAEAAASASETFSAEPKTRASRLWTARVWDMRKPSCNLLAYNWRLPCHEVAKAESSETHSTPTEKRMASWRRKVVFLKRCSKPENDAINPYCSGKSRLKPRCWAGDG